MLKKIVINLIILFVGILAIEIGLRFFPIPDPYEKEKVSIFHYFKPVTHPNRQLHFFYEDDMPGFADYNKEVSVSINSHGFRDAKEPEMEKEKGSFRIFTVGGSTTLSIKMGEGDDWSAQLSKLLNEAHDPTYEVINTGQSGHSLNEHLQLIVQKLVHMQPDLFIVYAGANDVNMLINGQYGYQTPFANAPKSPVLRHMITESQIGRRLNYIMKGLDYSEIHFTTKQRKRAREVIEAEPIEDKIPQIDLSFSITNLKSIIGICQSLGIRLLVVGQAVSWDETDTELDDWHFMVKKNGKRYSERVLRTLNTNLNSMMKEVCEEMEVPFVNAQEFMEPTSANFYDDMHMNFGGNKQMGLELFKYLESHPGLIGMNPIQDDLKP